MNYSQAKAYLLSKPHTVLDYPFGPDCEVYKVKGKMFATLAIGKMGNGDGKGNRDWWMNLKCDPEQAVFLRDYFEAVIPGYHMNKRLWNTVILDGSIPSSEVERMIDHSFEQVVLKLPKKQQLGLLE